MFRIESATPAESGYSMPAEWEAHSGCLMAWPNRSDLWLDRLGDAKRDYALVSQAISSFEPVLMVCNPGSAQEVRDLCGAGVTPLEIPINDSWARDSGPIFVTNDEGEVAAVSFTFNAWGERWHPFDDDARLGARLAEILDLPLFRAPMVLEGGAFLVDGRGTLLTTEQCLLNPNRNPSMNREQIEQGLKDYLGVSTILWVPFGHSLDVGPEGTDGHIDGVAQYLAPGHVLFEVPTSESHSEYSRATENLRRLDGATDALGNPLKVTRLEPDPTDTVPYANHYIANGGVVVPVAGDESDALALKALADLYPGREVVGVPGEALAYGGGGPHCITQQIPIGVALPS